MNDAKVCTHTDEINEGMEPKTPEGCEECLQIDDEWVQLRKCMTCGHVGCCDSSKNKHATKHFKDTQHPIIESYKAEETWRWCYIDEMYVKA